MLLRVAAAILLLQLLLELRPAAAVRVSIEAAPRAPFLFDTEEDDGVAVRRYCENLARRAAPLQSSENRWYTRFDQCASELSRRVQKGAADVLQPLQRTGLSTEFLSSVAKLYLPGYGTERMAPLLHSLVRFHRPERVVEFGFGYTTPFLAKALADNANDVAEERKGDSALHHASVLAVP